MRGTIADYLRDFGSGAPRSRAARPSLEPDEGDLTLSLTAPQPAADVGPDVEAVATDAYERGRQEALLAQESAHEVALKALKAAHAEEVERLRAAFEVDAARRIEAAYADTKAALATSIGLQVSKALSPFLDEWVRERTVARMARSLTEAFGDGKTAIVKVQGPAGLFEALRAQFDEDTVRFEFTEADDVDLTVEFDGTIFATRLADWSEALKEALQ